MSLRKIKVEKVENEIMKDSFSPSLAPSECSDSSSDTGTLVEGDTSNKGQENVTDFSKDDERLQKDKWIRVRLVEIEKVIIHLKRLYNALKNKKRYYLRFASVQPPQHIHTSISTLQDAHQCILEIIILYRDMKKGVNELDEKFRQIPSFLLEDEYVKEVEELQNRIASRWDEIKKYYLQLGDICYLLQSLKNFEKFRNQFATNLNWLEVRSQITNDEANAVSDDIEFYKLRTRKVMAALRKLGSNIIKYPHINLPSPELFKDLIKQEMATLESDYHSNFLVNFCQYRPTDHNDIFSLKGCPDLNTRSNVITLINTKRARIERCGAKINTGKIVKRSIVSVILFMLGMFAITFYFDLAN